MNIDITSRKQLLAEVGKSLDAEGVAQDLQVGADETVVLSTRSAMKTHYRQIRPKSVAELKAIIGVPDGTAMAASASVVSGNDAAKAVANPSGAAMVKRGQSAAPPAMLQRNLRALPTARLIGTDRLVASPDVDESERMENMEIAHAATRAYVYGDGNFSSAHLPLIERYLQLRDPVIFVPYFRDITVLNGGTLSIAANTLALFANRIRLHGTGRIVCNGPKTLHCSSFEGYL